MTSQRRSRLHASLARLGEAVADIVHTAEGLRGKRCPHRDRNDDCHYPGGCRNQVRTGDQIRCGGDRCVNWEAPPSPAWEPPVT